MMFSTNYSRLPEAQKSLLPMLSGSKKAGFVLYGGTALSLRLGHRESTDFDFFSSCSLNSVLFDTITLLKCSKVIQEEKDIIVFETSENVKISFFGNIDFGCINCPELTDDNNLYVASIIDIMGTKLKTLLQRISIKDYIDIAEIIKSGIKLETGLSAAVSLYKNQFPAFDALRALTYFDVKELQDLSKEYKKVLVTTVKNINIEGIKEIPLKLKNISDINNVYL